MRKLKFPIIIMIYFITVLVNAQDSIDISAPDSRDSLVIIPDTLVVGVAGKDSEILNDINGLSDTSKSKTAVNTDTTSTVKISPSKGIEKIIPKETLEVINRINFGMLIEILLLIAAVYLLSKLIDRIFLFKKPDTNIIRPRAFAGILKTIIWLILLYLMISMFIKASYEILPVLLAAVILFSMAAMLPFAFNFTGGLFISFAMPFVENDYIETDEYKGIVKKVTLKATTIFNEELGMILIPNSYFLKHPVANASKSKAEHTVAITFEFPAGIDSKFLIEVVKTAALANPYTSTENQIKVYTKEIDLINKLQRIELYVNICDSKFENDMKNLLNINILQVLKKEKRI